MGGRPYVLTEVALSDTQRTRYEVAVLPWGATEPHNFHLPFGTDSIQAARVAHEAARLSWQAGVRIIVLPAIPIGANAQQLGTPLTLNLSPTTQGKILEDLVASLEGHVPKLLILNGHGGNDFRQMIRELQPQTSVFLCTANWYSSTDPEEFFDDPGDHAGELETSVMLHLEPDLVKPLSEAGPGRAKVFRVKGLRDGTAWSPRDWTAVTQDTGVGNPASATAGKGEAFFNSVAGVLSEFLNELASADLGDLYVEPSETDS